MSDREADQLAVFAFKITIYLIFGVVILLFVGFRDHPKATLILLGLAVLVGGATYLLGSI